MTTRALRELLECIDDGDLDRCSMGDHAQHDLSTRGAAAVAVGWDAIRAPNALLEAARHVLGIGEHPDLAEAWEELKTAVADAAGEDEPA